MSNSVLTKTEGSLYRQVGRPPFTFMVLVDSPLPPASPLDSNPTSVSTSRRKLWSDHGAATWVTIRTLRPLGARRAQSQKPLHCPPLTGDPTSNTGVTFFLPPSANVVSACLSLTGGGGKPASYDFINLAPHSDSVIIPRRPTNTGR